RLPADWQQPPASTCDKSFPSPHHDPIPAVTLDPLSYECVTHLWLYFPHLLCDFSRRTLRRVGRASGGSGEDRLGFAGERQLLEDRTVQQRAAPPTAGPSRRLRIPLVWIVPLLTALIALWLVWDSWSKRGPTITISFETADGLSAGQSQLKYKN